ncbi:MAG TPA: PKD domain-containing protein [Candidatus Thermoplasmatota archaeon]|nr:PKD domain-containing protein [Candidatus Thermoplasmatota archaeon]
MTNRHVLLVLATVSALALAGCTGAVVDPKDDALSKQGGANATAPATGNLTAPSPPGPVARAQVFETGGALLYATPFEGGDGLVPRAVTENVSITFSASESESPGRVASLTGYAWRFSDGRTLEGVTVSRTFEAAGVYEARLTATDSNGRSDNITLKLGVNPAVVAEVSVARDIVPLMADPAIGAEFELVNMKTHAFAVNDSVHGVPAKLEKLVIRVAPDQTPTALDLNLRARNETATFASAFGVSQSETIVLSSFPVGKLLVDVVLNQGVAGGYVLTVEIHYRPIHPAVAALLAGDGHAHAH